MHVKMVCVPSGHLPEGADQAFDILQGENDVEGNSFVRLMRSAVR